MKKECNVCWMAALGGMTIAFFGFAVMLHGWPSSTVAAAWIQATGSVLAILAAFFIAQDQHRKELKRQASRRRDEMEAISKAERVEEARLLQALRDEIEVRTLQFHLIVGEELEKCSTRALPFFDSYNLMAEDPFPVYRSLLPRLTLIQNKEVRQKIIRCYAAMESLVLTVMTNSEFAREFQAADIAFRNTAGAKEGSDLSQKKARLIHYFPILISMRDTALKEVAELLDLLPDVGSAPAG